MLKTTNLIMLFLLILALSSCTRKKSWSCECENSTENHGIFEGTQKKAEEWCTSQSMNDDCVLIGHR